MGRVEKRDEDTAVVIPTSDGRSGPDPDPDIARRRLIHQQDPIPDDEWIRGERSKSGFTLKTPDPSPDEETNEWIHAAETVNAEDRR